MAVKIVTDSTSDLPSTLAKEWDITVLPLNVHFQDQVYKDGIDLTSEQFFERLRSSPRLPTTSQPSVGEFLDIYRRLSHEGHDVVSIHISEKMSGTLNSARQATAEMGSTARIEVIDSTFNSMALGLISLEAARVAKSGAGLQAVVEATRDAIGRSRLYATVDTLEYAARGGRIGKAQAFLGNVLQVKPILQIKEGEVHPVERTRTRERALSRLIELVQDYGQVESMSVFHAVCPDEAEILAGRLQPLLAQGQIILATVGPVIGTYVGPGALGVSFLTRRP